MGDTFSVFKRKLLIFIYLLGQNGNQNGIAPIIIYLFLFIFPFCARSAPKIFAILVEYLTDFHYKNKEKKSGMYLEKKKRKKWGKKKKNGKNFRLRIFSIVIYLFSNGNSQ